MVELGTISIRDEDSIVHCRNKIRVLAVDLNFTFVQATRIATASSEICWGLLDNENNSCVDVCFDKIGERFGLLLVFQGVSERFNSMKNEFLFDKFSLLPGDHGKQNIHAFKFFPDPTFVPPGNFIEAEKSKINQLSREELMVELSTAKDLAESASLIAHSTIENMGQGIFMVDAKGNVLVCNDVLLEYLNISQEQANSLKTAEDLRRLGSKNFSEENVQQSSRTAREGIPTSYDIATLDGRTLGVNQNSIAGGGFVRTYTDLTERKRAETALVEQSALVKLLRTTASEANSATNFKEAIQSCLTTVCNHTNWPVGHAYFLSNEDDSILVSSGIWHLDDPKKFTTFVETTEKITFKAGIGLPGRVLESSESAWIVDVSKDPNFPRAKVAADINVCGAFAFPVLSRDKVVGVLEFFDEKASELNELLLATVTQIGSQLGRVFERQQTEENLRNSERQFRELLETSPIGVSIITRNDRLIFFNSRVMERTGYSAEELETIHASDIHKSSEVRKKLLEMAVRREPIRDYEVELVRKDGTSWWSLMTVDQIEFEGQRGSLTWDFDISEQKAAEQEIERSRDLAEAATQAKSSFLAAMSHEIRTPMNGVVGMIDLLQQTEMDTDQRIMLRTVRDSAFALLGIINDILDFSKIEAGKLDLEIIPVSIRDVVEGVAQTLLPTSNKKDVRLLIYIDPKIPPWVEGDPVRLRQIIFNLAGNAIKFTESRNGEQGVVTVRVDRIKAKSKNKVALQFSVTDTGIGISQEGVDNLFKPFSQAESSTTRRFGGTGLGLSICKNLTDLMRGEIGVSSEEGIGSTFTFNVSLMPSNIERANVEQTDLAGLKILLAIKQQTTLDFTTQYLKHSRIEISNAGVVDEVPELLKAAKQAGDPFDILLIESTWDENRREELVGSLRKDIPELRYLILTDDQKVKKGLVQPDTMVVQNSPLLRSAFILGVGVVAGRASPDLAEDAPELRLKGQKVLTVEEAEAVGQLVLVAEDNLTNQDVIRRQLNLLGYTAEIAFDGKEAFELWQSKNYGLLLSDVHMPEMDGYELTAAIRKAEADSDKRFPIVAITANALQGEADKCLQAGMDDYLAKPLEMDKLKRMLSKWLPHIKSDETPSPNKTNKASTTEIPEGDKTKALPAIDSSALTSVFGDDTDTIHEILGDFVGPATDNVKEIEEAYTKHSTEDVHTAAHKLKSSARSVGANELANSCLVLEQAGKEGNWQDIEREVPKLAGKLDDVLAYIKKL